MRISELIGKLNIFYDTYGDIPVHYCKGYHNNKIISDKILEVDIEKYIDKTPKQVIIT